MNYKVIYTVGKNYSNTYSREFEASSDKTALVIAKNEISLYHEVIKAELEELFKWNGGVEDARPVASLVKGCVWKYTR